MAGSNIYFPRQNPRNSTQWTSATSTTWEVPTGVHVINVVVLGGGGSGANYGSRNANGGSASAASIRPMRVNPGETLSVVVGAGGAGRSSSGQEGLQGGTSSVTGVHDVVKSLGGAGGLYATSSGSSTPTGPIQTVPGQALGGYYAVTLGEVLAQDSNEGHTGGINAVGANIHTGGGASMIGDGGDGNASAPDINGGPAAGGGAKNSAGTSGTGGVGFIAIYY